MPDLQYDTEIMRNCAATYKNNAATLKDIKESLQKKIDNLRNEYWKSSAGDAFMNMYEDSWANNVEKYADMLEEMAQMLENSATEYDNLTEYTKKMMNRISF